MSSSFTTSSVYGLSVWRNGIEGLYFQLAESLRGRSAGYRDRYELAIIPTQKGTCLRVPTAESTRTIGGSGLRSEQPVGLASVTGFAPRDGGLRANPEHSERLQSARDRALRSPTYHPRRRGLTDLDRSVRGGVLGVEPTRRRPGIRLRLAARYSGAFTHGNIRAVLLPRQREERLALAGAKGLEVEAAPRLIEVGSYCGCPCR